MKELQDDAECEVVHVDTSLNKADMWLSRLKLELFEAKTCCVVLAESCGNRLKV